MRRNIFNCISEIKGEPEWMLDFRLKSYQKFIDKPNPTWGPDLSSIDLEPIAIHAQSQIQHLPQLSELKLGRKPPIAPLPRL